ncbi:pentatricopeptide repeat-containing protein, partial [Tanacetum coccineum]
MLLLPAVFYDMALELMLKMRRLGITPNMFTFSSVLKACSGLDIYSKCGEIDDATVCVYAEQANSPKEPHKAQANHSSPIESFQTKQAIQVRKGHEVPNRYGTSA